MVRKSITWIALALLGGCAVPLTPEYVGRQPEHFDRLIEASIRETFFDPHSLRDTALSSPVMGRLGLYDAGWLVCLQANGKNRFGAYTGLSRIAYLIRNDEIVGIEQNSPFCRTQAMMRWPAFEKL